MSDQRRLRKAKQTRRDVRRAKKRNETDAVSAALHEAIGGAVAAKHPFDLLYLAAMVTQPDERERFTLPTPDTFTKDRCDGILAALINAPGRETTALLTVIGELLVSDVERQRRCRDGLAKRHEHLPRWIVALPEIDVYRAVRIAHVLGDTDEIVIGARINGVHELAVSVLIDHTAAFAATDAGVLPMRIAEGIASVTDSDARIVEMTPADARAWLEEATAPLPGLGDHVVRQTEGWPLWRELVRWLVTRMPEGGEGRTPALDDDDIYELCEAFFRSPAAGPFTSLDHGSLLDELVATGHGDPRFWSVRRIGQTIGRPYYCESFQVPLEVALDAPDLLRVYIPYVHAQNGIGDELTAKAIAEVDRLRSHCKREVLQQTRWELDDAC